MEAWLRNCERYIKGGGKKSGQVKNVEQTFLKKMANGTLSTSKEKLKMGAKNDLLISTLRPTGLLAFYTDICLDFYVETGSQSTTTVHPWFAVVLFEIKSSLVSYCDGLRMK